MDLTKYYLEICKAPFISKEEESSLFIRYNDPNTPQAEKDSIRNLIITSNLRFAFKQAKVFSNNEPKLFEELINAANEGLIVGFEKYDYNKDIRFLTYAGFWVKQRIYNEMARMRIVFLPIWKQQLGQRIQKAVDANPKITLSELKKMFVVGTISEKDVEEMHQTKYLTYYMEEMQEEEFQIDPIGEQVQRKLDDDKVWKRVNELPSPHREVIARCFGFEDGEEHSVSKISKALKIPKEEIKKIKQEGLQMLKKQIK